MLKEKPRQVITVLQWSGSVSALILALAGLLAEIIAPGHGIGRLGTIFWVFVPLGLVAAIVGVILDRQDESSVFWGDESGAAAAEYVIILAIVGTALAVAILLLSGAIATAVNETASCINTKGVSCSAPPPPPPPKGTCCDE